MTPDKTPDIDAIRDKKYNELTDEQIELADSYRKRNSENFRHNHMQFDLTPAEWEYLRLVNAKKHVWREEQKRLIERERKLQKAKKTAADLGLAELKGAQKFVEWAIFTRYHNYSNYKIHIDRARKHFVSTGNTRMVNACDEIQKFMIETDSPKWWREHDFISPYKVLQYGQYLVTKKEMAAAEAAILAVPDSCLKKRKYRRTQPIAISVLPDDVQIQSDLDRKKEAKLIAREQYFQFVFGRYHHSITPVTGTAPERAACLASAYLDAGYDVYCLDSETRYRTIACIFRLKRSALTVN